MERAPRRPVVVSCGAPAAPERLGGDRPAGPAQKLAGSWSDDTLDHLRAMGDEVEADHRMLMIGFAIPVMMPMKCVSQIVDVVRRRVVMMVRRKMRRNLENASPREEHP